MAKKKGRTKEPKPEYIELDEDEDELPSFAKEILGDVDNAEIYALLRSLPYKEMILSLVMAYAWKKAYGDSGGWKIDDIMLGILYGFTLPSALSGSEVGAAFAVGELQVLLAGFIPENIRSSVLDYVKEGYAAASPLAFAILRAQEVYDKLKNEEGIGGALPIPGPPKNDIDK